MRILVQIVERASVKSEGVEVAKIGLGELIFVGFKPGDSKLTVWKMVDKLLKLRVFSDGEKTNRSLFDVQGEVLAVSQFTLYASLQAGNRPSFSSCLSAEEARSLFDVFKEYLSASWPKTAYGIFQADMKVELVNDGPFTVLLDSEELGYV